MRLKCDWICWAFCVCVFFFSVFVHFDIQMNNCSNVNVDMKSSTGPKHCSNNKRCNNKSLHEMASVFILRRFFFWLLSEMARPWNKENECVQFVNVWAKYQHHPSDRCRMIGLNVLCVSKHTFWKNFHQTNWLSNYRS